MHVSKTDLSSLPEPTTSDEISYLKIGANNTEPQLRLIVALDMSNSMFAGPCPDSIDTMIPNVSPSSNCLAPLGADATGRRFKMLVQWIQKLKTLISDGKIQKDNVKIMIAPYSGGIVQRIWTSIATGGFYATTLKIPINDGYLDPDIALVLVYTLWAVEAKYHNEIYPAEIPVEVARAVDAKPALVDSGGSTGTSIPANAFSEVNGGIIQKISADLAELRSRGALESSFFEFVFLSDGVPKPHSLHIHQVLNYIWANKNVIYSSNPTSELSCSDSDNDGWCDRFRKGVDAKKCIQRCYNFAKSYSETGFVSLPNSEKQPSCTSWSQGSDGRVNGCIAFSDGSTALYGQNMTCGSCFQFIYQFDSETADDLRGDLFKYKISSTWGDFTLNRMSYIIQQLKTIQNIFKKQFAGAKFRYNFVRLNGLDTQTETPIGEMVKTINWFEKSKDYFSGKEHRFTIAGKSGAVPFDLFPIVSVRREYRVTQVYAYSLNARLNSQGLLQSDSDGDGVPDFLEKTDQVLKSRSNGICLDSIKAMVSECISIGCDPNIDMDGDGLNQCEELTLGTDDSSPDSDGDGIIDGAEILFGLSALTNDQTTDSNSDGNSNFIQFVKGATAYANLSNIDPRLQLNLSTQYIGQKEEVDIKGNVLSQPGYRIQLTNVPVLKTADLVQPNENHIIVIIKVENTEDSSDTSWLSKKYTILTTQSNRLSIRIEDFRPLKNQGLK